MSSALIRKYTKTLLMVCVTPMIGFSNAFAQTITTPTATLAPSPIAESLTAAQKQLIQSATPEQLQQVRSIVTPLLQKAMQNRKDSASGTFRSWQDIITNRQSTETSGAKTLSASGVSVSTVNTSFKFEDKAGLTSVVSGIKRDYHPANQSNTALLRPTCCHPIPANPDQDGDGLPDSPDLGDLEGSLARSFLPVYFISSGEQQQFATFGDYVPWTVINTVGTNPPNSYYHVTPLGLTTDSAGNQLYAIRVDYLSLWNADGGLVGGGGACLYSYVGLDNVVQELTGHNLDDERSVMLLAAPAVMGSFNPDPTAYSLYSIYTAAHEGTFFDQSAFADLNTPLPAGSHVHLYQSLSKHSTYFGDPDLFAITPFGFIYDTEFAITSLYLDGDIDFFTYSLSIAIANDVFFGCLIERFGDQGGVVPSPIYNVGEVYHPLNGNGFIQDNSSPLHLSDKLTAPVF